MAGINLTEIQQKVDRLLFNVAEQNRRAYEVFFSPTPAEVELPQLDENGNLTTVKIPNRALIKKQFWDDVNAAVGLWNRTLYVHPDGDDNAPGTEDAPLTLEGAIESIPPGGIGTIYLKAATTCLINKNLTLRGRRVKLTKWGTGDNPIVTTTVSEATDTVVLNYIGVDGGHINFDKVDLLLPEYDGDKPAHSTYNSLLIPLYNSYGAVGISFHYNKIILNRDFKLINGFNYGGGYDFLVSQFWGTEIVVNSANARLLQAHYSPTALYFGVVTITDNTDSNISLPDLIDGISRNSDGTPRNVLSNISL